MKLCVRNASVTLSGNTILEEVNFEVNSNEHIAIVGRNGAGKTTLLKALIHQDLFDEGIGEEKFSVTSLGKYSIGYLKQIDLEDENRTLLEEVKSMFTDLLQMEKKLNQYVEEMNLKQSDLLIQEYTDLQERFKLMGGYSYQKEYEVMLNKFGFSENDKQKKISSFSGGQKTKIAFMKLLLGHYDLLFLDEPTNHLDIEAIEWLEEYLKTYKGALVIVSHDRMFLDNIVSIVYDIDYGKTVKYVGSYSHYEKEKKALYERMLKEYEFQQKEIKRLTAIYERFRFKPSKASMALSKLHQIERMDLIDKPNKIDTNTFKTNLKEMVPSVKKVLIAEDLEIGYKEPLAKLDLTIIRGNKIGVIGANGTGKSTLLKTIQGILEPISGNISYGLQVTPGYFDQTLAMLDKEHTMLEEFRESLPTLTEEQARSALGSFLFKGEDVFKKVNVLSGGEKVRLQLCKILYHKPNFLILDEPTNHMDIIGKEHLEDILEQYEGTLLFVSHDRYFVKKIATQLLVFDQQGVTFYPYGYEEYQENIKHNKKEEIIQTKKKEVLKPVEEKVNLYEIQKELRTIENIIIKLESKIDMKKQELFKKEVYTDVERVSQINHEIEKYKKELESLNERWEEVTDIILKEKSANH